MSHIAPTLTKKDFSSDQMVRWCPGCGDYAILSAMQTALPRLGRRKEDFVFISGIGCAARFPYYMETYGFHTIHGRAPALALGTKLANPELSVWIITGDGDSMAIGGNHFIHAIRRNVDVNLIIFNNEIYGLTKGQYSPTSQMGQVTKSTPYGVAERPFSAAELALGAGATFFARTVDTNPKHMAETFVQAEQHRGLSVVEVLQNCVIFNDGAFANVTDRKQAADIQLHLEHGEPMRFGKDKDRGIRLNGLQLETVQLGEEGVTEDDLLVHDAQRDDPTLHGMLARVQWPDFPLPVGVLRAVERPVYEQQVLAQHEASAARSRIKSVDALLASGHTWEITD